MRRIRANAQSIHHRLDGVFLLGVDFRHGVEFVHATVDAHAHETLTAELLEDFRVFALAVDDERRQQKHGEAFRQLGDLVHHLAHGLRRKIDAVIRAACDAGAREHQT